MCVISILHRSGKLHQGYLSSLKHYSQGGTIQTICIRNLDFAAVFLIEMHWTGFTDIFLHPMEMEQLLHDHTWSNSLYNFIVAIIASALLASLTLPYICHLSQMIRRILTPLRICTCFWPHCTLRQTLVRLKDQTPLQQRAGVIYWIPCGTCSKVYIGQTGSLSRDHFNTFETTQKAKEEEGEVVWCEAPARCTSIKADFVNTIGECFDKRKTEGSVEDRWKELKQTIMEASKEHLQWKNE